MRDIIATDIKPFVQLSEEIPAPKKKEATENP
jgi:hypothetical protein